MVDPDVVGLLQQLVLDPQPLCAALARYPKTLVHGDYRGMNAGIRWQNPPQVVLLDWQLAGCGAATIDLAWFINQPRVRLSPVTTEAGIAYYRQRLAEQLGSRFDGESWEPLLNLGLLANILRMGCFTAWFILHSEDETEPPILRKTLHLFNQQARMASKWL
jgi:aminoglycoside/choline kinase family phosphotransferase